MQHSNTAGCILLKFYIKPQLRRMSQTTPTVVSYWNSTSNHNYHRHGDALFSVVSYWNSTSNHNCDPLFLAKVLLYLIEILHQTTTGRTTEYTASQLYLIEILHQTTTEFRERNFLQKLYLIEILHQTTTVRYVIVPLRRCILLKFYIKPQLSVRSTTSLNVVSYWNSTSNHNLAHIILWSVWLYLIEILHQTTTLHGFRVLQSKLYLIEILHQTTTV